MIELHIGELILEGFPRSDRYRIAEAVQIELRRLIEAHGLQPSRHALCAPSITVKQGEAPAAVGARIGQSIFHSIGGKTS